MPAGLAANSPWLLPEGTATLPVGPHGFTTTRTAHRQAEIVCSTGTLTPRGEHGMTSSAPFSDQSPALRVLSALAHALIYVLAITAATRIASYFHGSSQMRV